MSDRFLDRIVKDDSGCWLWTGARDGRGYARASFQGKNARVHRVLYERFVGPIPTGLTIDHLCGVRHCVNPAHLEAVTLVENIARGSGVGVVNAAKTHCPQGHAYDAENTLFTSRGHRQCRACKREQSKTRDWAADYRRRRGIAA